MRAMRGNRFERGLTLVELMIGITLSLLLLTGTISIFMGSKQTFRLQEDLARVQESLRYAVSRMITDISPAGYLGCAPSTQGGDLKVENMVAGRDDLYDFEKIASGAEGRGANGSDHLTVRFALPESGMPVIAAMGSGDRPVRVDPNYPGYAELERGDIIAVSDCKALAVFMITNNPSSSGGRLAHAKGTMIRGVGNKEAGISHAFGDPRYATAMVYKMDAVTYELRKIRSGGKTLSALYARRLGGRPQQLLAGVEDFQVEYGIDENLPPDGAADRFMDWSQVAAANKEHLVSSLRIRMTVNPGEPVPGTTGIDPDFSKEVAFTVKLRNRLADL
ncbi:MAG TPA: hypothetical protein ENI99_03135 [Sedimenticola sp.]|nr:hypothetical protein [Sedimenticola sp.]